jgi:glycosyltransferase involved in cell wall biosynthesis
MRILHILDHIQETSNGTVNATVDLACLQAKVGYKVAIASTGGKYEILLKQYGVQHFQFALTKKLGRLLKAARRYRAIIREFQPDIVHTHVMKGVVFAYALRMRAGYALVSTVHNEFQRSAVLVGLADRVIAVSNAVAKSMERRGVPRKRLRVVCNGTLGSPRRRQLAEVLPLPLQRPAITTVAGMYRRKGIAELIDAFEQIALNYPQAHLYLVGSGPDQAQFKAKAQGTAVTDRIHFEGFQPEPQHYLLATDVFVLASHREPFGLVLSEAREAGCAIIASNVDGIPEALDGGQAGLLVPPGDSRALAEALARFLSAPKELYKWKGQAQHNLEWLSVARVHEETLAVYRELVVIASTSIAGQTKENSYGR